jgi:hypothetical protein
MRYGTVAASHLNMSLRLFEQAVTSCITGKKFATGGAIIFTQFVSAMHGVHTCCVVIHSGNELGLDTCTYGCSGLSISTQCGIHDCHLCHSSVSHGTRFEFRHGHDRLAFICSHMLLMFADDKALQAAVEHGHKWWILSEKISSEEAMLISEYRNSDQNTNQVPGPSN